MDWAIVSVGYLVSRQVIGFRFLPIIEPFAVWAGVAFTHSQWLIKVLVAEFALVLERIASGAISISTAERH